MGFLLQTSLLHRFLNTPPCALQCCFLNHEGSGPPMQLSHTHRLSSVPAWVVSLGHGHLSGEPRIHLLPLFRSSHCYFTRGRRKEKKKLVKVFFTITRFKLEIYTEDGAQESTALEASRAEKLSLVFSPQAGRMVPDGVHLMLGPCCYALLVLTIRPWSGPSQLPKLQTALHAACDCSSLQGSP